MTLLNIPEYVDVLSISSQIAESPESLTLGSLSISAANRSLIMGSASDAAAKRSSRSSKGNRQHAPATTPPSRILIFPTKHSKVTPHLLEYLIYAQTSCPGRF